MLQVEAYKVQIIHTHIMFTHSNNIVHQYPLAFCRQYRSLYSNLPPLGTNIFPSIHAFALIIFAEQKVAWGRD